MLRAFPSAAVFSLRRASVTLHKGNSRHSWGLQFIRWVKADIFKSHGPFRAKGYFGHCLSQLFSGVVAARVTYIGPHTGTSSAAFVHAKPPPLASSTMTVLPRSAGYPYFG